MTRKFLLGHVTGGRVYGYDNVEVMAQTAVSGCTSSAA